MSLSPEQIRRVATLARLDVSEAEIPTVQQQLNNILQLIDQMQAVDTTGVEPMSNALDLAQRLRADVVTEKDRREAYQGISPETEGGLFLVPKVIE